MKITYFYILSISPILGYIIFSIFSLPPYYFLGFASVLILFHEFFINKNSHIIIPKFYFLLIILFIYYFIWDIFNGNIADVGIFKAIFKWDFNPLNVFAILVIIYSTPVNDKFIKNIILIFKITIVIAVIVSLAQLIINPNFFIPEYFSTTYNKYFDIYQARRPSIFGFLGDNDLGFSFLPIMSLVIAYLLRMKDKTLYYWIILGGIVCVLSNARYIIIGYIIILFQVIIHDRLLINKFFLYSSGLILLALILMFLLSNIGGYNLNDYYQQRLLSESADSRLLAGEMMIKFLPKYPIFGNGLSLSKEISDELGGRSSQIHVGYFSHLVSYGIFGSIILYTFWILLLKSLYKKARITNFYGSFFSFAIFLWANSVMVYYSLFTYGLIFSFIFDKYYYDKFLQTNAFKNRIK